MKKASSNLPKWIIGWIAITLVPAGCVALVSGSIRDLVWGMGIFGAITGVFLFVAWLWQTQRFSKVYQLERRGAKRLEVSWAYNFTETRIKLDGNEIGIISTANEAKEGKTFQLPDGSSLNIKIMPDSSKTKPEPTIILNGKPIPESANDPAKELKVASNGFIVGGAFNLLAGVLFSSTNPVWYTVLLCVLGITAPIVGIFIRRMSRTALNIGIVYGVIAALSFLLAFVSDLTGGSGSLKVIDGITSIFGNISELIQAVIYTTALQKGFKAMDEIEKEGVKSI